MSRLVEVNRHRPCLESLTINAKAEVASQGLEIRILPRTTRILHPLHYLARLTLKALCLQSRHKHVRLHLRDIRYPLIARRIFILMKQMLVIRSQALRNGKHHLRNHPARRSRHLHISLGHHMENHIIVSRIPIMPMPEPVGSFQMQLHITHPFRTVHTNLGIEEVRTRITSVMQSRVNHLHRLIVGSGESTKRVQSVFPCVVKQFLHN